MELSKEEQEAIEFLNNLKSLDITMYSSFWSKGQFKFSEEEIQEIDTVLNLIQKQSKVIDEMAGYLAIIRDCPNEDMGANLDCENRCNNTDEIYEECWKQYFYRKVERR